jgi:pimeloyl-ACP methyl ester carboxylesterase
MRASIRFLVAGVILTFSPLVRAEQRTVVVGFVGGFVKHDDPRHAEVRFAAYLRQKYGQKIDVAVFGNHSERNALEYVLRTLPTSDEPARIIIFGHSWGGTATLKLARELEEKDIPVLLTIQIDSIAKPGQANAIIPANVARAVNFYQSKGLLHGQTQISARDRERTKIIGNFEMQYRDHPVNCDEFPWYSRLFTKSHIEIENDPRVWQQAATYIDQELTGSRGGNQGVFLATMRK